MNRHCYMYTCLRKRENKSIKLCDTKIKPESGTCISPENDFRRASRISVASRFLNHIDLKITIKCCCVLQPEKQDPLLNCFVTEKGRATFSFSLDSVSDC